jgi:hypothetical protein
MVLEVNLEDRTKAVSEHGGAPEAYYNLEAYLQQGAGAQGLPYVPDEGYVTLQPFSVDASGEPWPVWSGLNPEDVKEGDYVRGAMLAFAWDQVNRNPTGPTYVTHEGKTYHMMVQIPGVSYAEPPAPVSPLGVTHKGGTHLIETVEDWLCGIMLPNLVKKCVPPDRTA